ncbi:hypothetical protein ACIBKY_38515 [Nonomuraea sp. NPDC050394]|uniref:hypothetical protein n=1 Tax=Nonomuraea sp. NPDC050394 TaxID=3364363 RepID=UPI0037B1B4BB
MGNAAADMEPCKDTGLPLELGLAPPEIGHQVRLRHACPALWRIAIKRIDSAYGYRLAHPISDRGQVSMGWMKSAKLAVAITLATAASLALAPTGVHADGWVYTGGSDLPGDSDVDGRNAFAKVQSSSNPAVGWTVYFYAYDEKMFLGNATSTTKYAWLHVDGLIDERWIAIPPNDNLRPDGDWPEGRRVGIRACAKPDLAFCGPLYKGIS